MEQVVAITVRGVTYHLSATVWRLARETFRQQYQKGVDVPTLARRIARELMPQTEEDYFSEERLRRCLLSHFGKRGGRRASLPHQGNQLSLFGDA